MATVKKTYKAKEKNLKKLIIYLKSVKDANNK